MLDMEQRNINALLALVRNGLWENEPRFFICQDVDYNEVYRYADEKSVVGLIAVGLEKISGCKVSQDISLQIAGQALQLEQQNVAMNRFVARLVEKMRNEGIYTLLVKGQGVAQCYKRPLWRACGDIDFFLSEDNYKKAKDLLLPIAETIEQEWLTSMHLGMNIEGWVVELHGSLRGSLSPKINNVLDNIRCETFYEGKVRSKVINGTQIFMLDINNDIIYVFTHFLNHFYKGGIGLRQICDWCRLLWSFKDSLNHELLMKRIRKAGLMAEWKAFAVLAVEYLGMPKDVIPLYDVRGKKKAEQILKHILKGGPYNVICDTWAIAKIFPWNTLKFAPAIFLNVNGLKIKERLFN